MKRIIVISMVLVLIIFVSACKQEVSNNTQTTQSPEKGSQVISKGEQDSSNTLANKDQILKEINRILQLNNQESIKVEDFETLETMLEGNEDTEHELEELQILVKYKEYKHAGHGLSFLDGFIRTGKELMCPAHELAHYYVFKRHNEEESAEHALEEAEEQMPEWTPLAREYDKKYPSGLNFDELVETLNEHLESIEKGDTTATEEEINFLANEASICIEEE